MSPNHKAYVAVTVHFEKDGISILMLLDIVEVTHLQSGLNLAAAFSKILDDFRIVYKVSNFFFFIQSVVDSQKKKDPVYYLQQCVK